MSSAWSERDGEPAERLAGEDRADRGRRREHRAARRRAAVSRSAAAPVSDVRKMNSRSCVLAPSREAAARLGVGRPPARSSRTPTAGDGDRGAVARGERRVERRRALAVDEPGGAEQRRSGRRRPTRSSRGAAARRESAAREVAQLHAPAAGERRASYGPGDHEPGLDRPRATALGSAPSLERRSSRTASWPRAGRDSVVPASPSRVADDADPGRVRAAEGGAEQEDDQHRQDEQEEHVQRASGTSRRRSVPAIASAFIGPISLPMRGARSRRSTAREGEDRRGRPARLRRPRAARRAPPRPRRNQACGVSRLERRDQAAAPGDGEERRRRACRARARPSTARRRPGRGSSPAWRRAP